MAHGFLPEYQLCSSILYVVGGVGLTVSELSNERRFWRWEGAGV